MALFFRAFVQVFLVSVNVSQIAAGHYAGAFLVGGAISWLWFGNARSAGRSDDVRSRAVYAAGAALGTVGGMFLSRCYL
ncbi:MAG: hypothetical protein ACO280_12835, partial [Pseudohongiellaceae bacterium]